MTGRLPAPAPGSRRLDERLRRAAEREEAAGLGRRCPPVEERRGLRYRLEGRELLSFCSNDYLGFAGERGGEREPSAEASGAAASRLVCGDLPEHRALEGRFAAMLGYEDAVLFPSGFQANVAVPASLLEGCDRAFSDALNHASMIDGLRLARAPRTIVEHLRRPPSASSRSDDSGEPGGRSWWFCESVFSMDGDGPALADLEAHLAEGGCLYLDEAHALGLYAGGRGRAAALTRKPTVLVAPLGKALGCAGAFVCASRVVCAWIRGHARGFVFTTGVSPVLLPRIERTLERVRGPEGDRRRAQLWRNVDRFRAALGERGLDLRGRGHASPIHPLVVGDNGRALALSRRLLERGFHVQAIRPPTVPEGAARLRVAISAGHEPEDIDRFARALAEELAGEPVEEPCR